MTPIAADQIDLWFRICLYEPTMDTTITSPKLFHDQKWDYFAVYGLL